VIGGEHITTRREGAGGGGERTRKVVATAA